MRYTYKAKLVVETPFPDPPGNGFVPLENIHFIGGTVESRILIGANEWQITETFPYSPNLHFLCTALVRGGSLTTIWSNALTEYSTPQHYFQLEVSFIWETVLKFFAYFSFPYEPFWGTQFQLSEPNWLSFQTFPETYIFHNPPYVSSLPAPPEPFPETNLYFVSKMITFPAFTRPPLWASPLGCFFGGEREFAPPPSTKNFS